MKQGDYFYALVREQKEVRGKYSSVSRQIKVGLRQDFLDINLFDLFTNIKKEAVARITLEKIDRGIAWGNIENFHYGYNYSVPVPLDDLVESVEVTSTFKK